MKIIVCVLAGFLTAVVIGAFLLLIPMFIVFFIESIDELKSLIEERKSQKEYLKRMEERRNKQ